MRKKLIVVFVMSVVLIALMTRNIFAASYKTSIVPSSTTVAPGGSVTLTIKISSIDAGNGIWNFSTVFDYDTTVFEEISDENISVDTTTGWQKTSYTQDTKKLILENTSFVTSDQDIVTITLKAKSDASATSSTFSLKNVTASNSEGDIAGQDVSTTLTIGEGGGEIIISNEIVTNDPVINEVDPGFENEVNEMLNQNTSSGETVPYTGVEDYIVPLIAVVVVLGIVSFINYKRLDENN